MRPTPAVLARKCDRSELYHVHVAKVSRTAQLAVELPGCPWEPVPTTKSPAMVAYLAAVVAELVVAIDRQGTGRVLPGRRAMAKHYGITPNDSRDVRDQLVEQHAVCQQGERYITVRREPAQHH